MSAVINEGDVIDSIDAEAEAARLDDEARRKKVEDEALIARWINRIDHGRKHDADQRKNYADDRKYARGDTGWLVDTNLIGAILEILMAFIYAKDPDISVRPSQAVGVSRLPQMTMVSKTIEIVISRLLRDARLKHVCKRWLRSAMTVGIGWIKVGMQTKTEVDPIVEKQINDLRENLARTEQLQRDLANGDVANEDEARAQLRANLTALEGQRERQVADGATLDFIAAEDIIVSPECGEMENYLASPWIAFDSYKTKDDARILCDWPDTDEYRTCFSTANLYSQRPRNGEESSGGVTAQYIQMVQGEGSESEFGFVKIIEIYSLKDGVVYTMIEGIRKWARQPYPPRTGKRFYPHFQLAFHYVDSERHPQSDVQLLKKLQDEFGRTRSNFAEHRRRAIPATFFDETQIDSKTMGKIKDSEAQEFIGVSTTNGQPMGNAFFPKPYAQVDPGLYSTDAVRVDMEKMSGAQDAQQGSVAVEKTLGEAEIQQSGFMARTGARRDAMEGVLQEVAEFLTHVALQVMDSSDAVRYAGPEAVWPKLSVDEALTLFDIEITAGSTGKPRNSMDKQTWGTIMPMMQELIDRIGQARIKGEEWAAKPWIALLRETALRLDDRIDVDAMLPVPPPPPPIDALVPGGMGPGMPAENVPDPGALAPLAGMMQ